ncbi:hypothetical protein NPIL_195061 [Nephila pilipes]|uniref:Uncharacterized protein n=1 Tax=Nephila pilipes TaxID=299642 RepID=A0A8X6T3Y3_NEPPI|nr:hypothetical protein NPIL_195061 [Nephila pilipes]
MELTFVNKQKNSEKAGNGHPLPPPVREDYLSTLHPLMYLIGKTHRKYYHVVEEAGDFTDSVVIFFSSPNASYTCGKVVKAACAVAPS